MKIATWNVNSIKVRLPHLCRWLKTVQPDIVCLQEIKSTEESFPYEALEDLGYNISVHGQKAYNGVAILSKRPFEEVQKGLPLSEGIEEDPQARYIEAVIMGDESVIRVSSLYVPNGNPVQDDAGAFSEKYTYKLAWLTRLRHHVQQLLSYEEPLILAGDYNVIPEAKDVHDPQAWWGDALYRPETLAAFRSLLGLGLTDGFAQMDGRAECYSFWDYQGGAWQRNHGIRIDHLLLSAQAVDQLQELSIERSLREGIKPSDHVPVIGEFSL